MITFGLFGHFLTYKYFSYALAVKRPDHRCFHRIDIGDALLRPLMCRHGALLRIVAVLDGKV